jgi:NAD(P)-dependent dehydrogenase (short-subunit alcohol dehydrogenase family)
MMNYDLTGKVAVVTGASRGIGKGIALDLADNGAHVVGVYVSNEEKAKETLSEIEVIALEHGGETEFLRADVSNEDHVSAMHDRVMEMFGRVDLLVNNAGIHQHLKSWELSLDDWNRVMTTNLTSQFLVSRAFIPIMKVRKFGRIVNISSCVAYCGTDHEIHYAASKSGTIALTKSLALELAPYNINVNAVAPGYIHSDMCAFGSKEEQTTTELKIPKRRIGVPKDIAKTVSFLCSEGSDYITGQMFHVNGGLIMP